MRCWRRIDKEPPVGAQDPRASGRLATSSKVAFHDFDRSGRKVDRFSPVTPYIRISFPITYPTRLLRGQIDHEATIR